MGVLIKWRSIDSEATYNYTKIYRATSETGSYGLIATQIIADQSYFDKEGTTDSWYKVAFYDSVNILLSTLSDAIQGGTIKGYCSIADVRNITNISTNDLTDTQICNLIEYIGPQVNSDIQIERDEEKISYISDVKNNKIDGINLTFWTRKYPIGDKNDDMIINTNDLEVYEYHGNETRTLHTVSSITPNTGKFILSVAPSDPVRVSYKSASLSVSDPHPLVKIACALLVAAWGYTKLNVGKAPHFRMGSTNIYRDMNSFETYYQKYLKMVERIISQELMDQIEGNGIPLIPKTFVSGTVPGYK